MGSKTKKGKAVIISRESDNRTLDIAMLEAELKRRGIEVKVLCRLLTKERSLKALGYAGHVMKQEAAILGADVVVLDTYCIPASMLPHRSGTKVIQMWHALSAIKKFGWQTVGKEGGSSEKTARLMRMHRGYDYIVSPSDITAKHFCEAFDAPPDKIVRYGLPRIDYIKSVACGSRQADTAKRICSVYPQLKMKPGDRSGVSESVKPGDGSAAPLRKQLILYAPTFRRGKAVDVQSLIDALDPERYELVVKLHPLYRMEPGTWSAVSKAAGNAEDQTEVRLKAEAAKDPDSGSESKQTRNVVYDDEFSSFDWLSVADIIISDYSSFVIESTLADKPLFIYAYDLEAYAENTGLNVDFEKEPIAPYVFRDAKALAACIDTCCAADEAGKDREDGSGSKDRKGGSDSKGGGAEVRDGAGTGRAYDMAALRAFRDRYIDIDTGAGDAERAAETCSENGRSGEDSENFCTARLADFIESLLQAGSTDRRIPEK